MSVRELDIALDPGATLHAYDTGGADRLAVVWHHGTPNVGAPPAPLFAAADRLGLRWVSYDRPGYGGSSPAPGRTIGDAAVWMGALLDALDIERCVAMGHSGGGSHTLASGGAARAALRGRRQRRRARPVRRPRDLDWFAGMAPSGQASLGAAAAGRAAKEAQAAAADGPDDAFTDTDMAALAGEWGWLGGVVRPAIAGGPGGLIDDDLALRRAVGMRSRRHRRPGAAAPRRHAMRSCRWTTAAGWPPASPVPSCASRRTTATSPCSVAARTRWPGSGGRLP